MISVSWSDETEVIVHRSFQDVKKFNVSPFSSLCFCRNECVEVQEITEAVFFVFLLLFRGS